MITMCAPSQFYETAFQNACGLSEEVMSYDFLSVSRPSLMLLQIANDCCICCLAFHEILEICVNFWPIQEQNVYWPLLGLLFTG